MTNGHGRVLLLTRTLGRGGTERQLAVLARGLERRGFDPLVVVFYDRATPLREELNVAGVRVIGLGKRGRFDLVGFGIRSWRLARSTRPDVVYGFLAGPNLLALLMKAAAPRAQIVWGVRSTNLGVGDRHWWTRLADWTQARLARFPDLVICNAESGRADVIERGFPAERTVVVPNGVDLMRFRPDADRRRVRRALLGVTDDECVVGIVGRVHPMKDHPTFFRAMALLRERVPSLSVWCVGAASPEERDATERLAERCGVGDRTIVLPPQSDVESLYPALDLLVSSSSHTEGLSNVLLEARACGVACVATRVGDAAKVLGDDGDVVPPRQPEVLAEACFAALTRSASERSARAVAGRDDVAQRFSDERMVESTLEHLGIVSERCG